MSIFTTKLDYNKVLANQENEVHVVTRIDAPELQSDERKPVAFTICLDRSSSMEMERKFDYALEACVGVVKNLRADDLFSLVTFDSEVEVVLPLEKIEDKQRVYEIIKSLSTRGMTYLSGGWEQAKDELLKAAPGMLKRMLLLSDGVANRGIRDHRELITLVGDGLRDHGIRTSCLGFGDHYHEDLLSDMATHSTGNFYDVDSKEKLSVVFAAELEGALRISVENLRVRIKTEEQCESWDDFGGMRKTILDDDRTELLIGDLVSEEVRSFALELKVRSADSGSIERLISMDFVYDLVGEDGLVPTSEERMIEISFANNPEDVQLDDTLLAIITTQRTSRTIRKAIEKIDQGEEREAIEFLRGELKKLEELGKPEFIADSEMLIRSTIEKIEMGWRRSRGRKFAQYSSRSYSKMSSSEYWSADESYSPSFKGTNDDEL